MIAGSGCEKCSTPSADCVCQRARIDRVGVAPAVQQEVFVLHVGKAFRVEGHADKVEVRVEAVDLERILDVVGRRAVAVVVGILALPAWLPSWLRCCTAGSGLLHRMSAAELHACAGPPCCACSAA